VLLKKFYLVYVCCHITFDEAVPCGDSTHLKNIVRLSSLATFLLQHDEKSQHVDHSFPMDWKLIPVDWKSLSFHFGCVAKLMGKVKLSSNQVALIQNGVHFAFCLFTESFT
jgi:hypothetical protein